MNGKKREDSIKFYDNYINYQITSGINERILNLYKRLKNRDLASNSTVLEIGCGIGVLTSLITKIVKTGKIEALDISPKSIKYAIENNKNKNVDFSAADFLEYETKNTKYDKILLFDVLEHIPLEHHKRLFIKISDLMKENSEILINIPNPKYIIFDQINQPEILQEIDQPIFLTDFLDNLKETCLEIVHFEQHSIWVENDYHFLIIKRKIEFEEIPLASKRSLVKKINFRLNKIADLRYKL